MIDIILKRFQRIVDSKQLRTPPNGRQATVGTPKDGGGGARGKPNSNQRTAKNPLRILLRVTVPSAGRSLRLNDLRVVGVESRSWHSATQITALVLETMRPHDQTVDLDVFL